ncbi:hypothetical protein HDV05_004434 [Chytridiales sp. JEL 0842]|nr:hypothetical protein HDV05_004434 [Chytridiales sp. JEL 0842]
MPIGHSPLKLVALKTAATLLDAIPFISVLYATFYVYELVQQGHSHVQEDAANLPGTTTTNLTASVMASILRYARNSSILSAYLLCEASFYLFFLLQHNRLQSPRPLARLDSHDRGAYFYRVLDDFKLAKDPQLEFRRFVTGWFFWNKDRRQLEMNELKVLKRGNIEDWLSWAFFTYPSIDELSKSEFGAELMEELHSMVDDMEDAYGISFPPGLSTEIGSVKLNYNEIEAYAKPLIFYVVVYLLESICGLYLRVLGFDKYSQGEARFAGRTAENPATTYWCWIPDSKEKGGRDVINTKEVPLVMRLVDYVPSMQQTVAEVEDMLQNHGYTQAHIVGHSLGTAYCSWMVKHSKIVKSCVLLDPIVFMTYHPSLAYNFVHRHPGKNVIARANEFLMHWIVSRELYISHYIGRNFHWHQNVLWPEQLPKKHYVVVGRGDNLIDGNSIAHYLKAHGTEFVAYDLDHAEFILNTEFLREIVGKLTNTINSADEDYRLKKPRSKKSFRKLVN